MKILAAVAFLALSTTAIAGEGDVYGVKIESLAVIATATGGHLPGNFEIKIAGGFTLPPHVSCEPLFITTKQSIDPKGRMFALLQDAVAKQLTVGLRITDAPELTAYRGRCSLEVVRFCREDLPRCGDY
ncbi:MAG TPA: hypothetical protein VGK20_05000 [Candidatus Binatia bacterium]|jgi:hypothetical protein